MRVVVFAHTPPPFHGQSYMVKLMLDGLGGDLRKRTSGARPAIAQGQEIECFHVNAQLSGDLEEIGLFQIRKLFRLVRYCLEALWCRFRYRADTLYYIPAPPKRIAFYRDCFVLLVCRPVFRNVIFHWEASGLSEWVDAHASSWERRLARSLFGAPDLSVSLAESLAGDAVYFRSKRVHSAPNGIEDPCPEFDKLILPVRLDRLDRRRKSLEREGKFADESETYRVVFLAHCTREKGLFDALEGIAIGNRELKAQGQSLRMHLSVAGAFLRENERREFDSWQERNPGDAHYAGFLTPAAKTELLKESDCLCFPTYYSAEAQPVSIVEAMAFGLAVVATAWRGIPELLPRDYRLLTPDHSPAAVASCLLESMEANVAENLRRHYCGSYTAARYVENLSRAFHSVE